MPRSERRCKVTPDKRRYHDECQAKAALRLITTRGDRRRTTPVRWYHCDPLEAGCNGYHLTSQES